MDKKRRVLIIGLDGATFDLLLPLIEQGHMPVLKSLIARGVSARLTSTIPPVTAPAWVTFQTGVNPGKHGMVEFMQPAADYSAQLATATNVSAKSIWTLLSEAGKKVVTVNVPLTYPPHPVNGYVVSGMLAPNTEVEFTAPPELGQELLQHVPGYQIMPLQNLAYVGLEKFVANMCDVIDKRAQAALYLMRRAEWDVFMVHFQAIDVLQHALWSHLDPRHPDYARTPEAERDRVRQFYRRLDENLAKVSAGVDDQTDIVVMSDHGFGSALKRIYINQWLANEKYLTLTTSPALLKTLGVLEDVVRRVDVFKLRRRIKPAFGQRDQMLRGLTQDHFIDWTQSRVFGFSGTHFANVYVNRRGRFAHGTVSAEEADRLCAEIATKLLQWIEPATGQRLIEQVYRREEVYRGPQVEWLPDLMVRPRAGYIFETRFKRGWLTGPLPADLTGVHRMDGIFIGAGPRFRAAEPIGAALLIDMPPTLLYLLDTPVPREMDGRILTEFIQPEYVAQHPADTSAATVVTLPVDTDESPYTPEEQQTILEHLGRLGYL